MAHGWDWGCCFCGTSIFLLFTGLLVTLLVLFDAPLGPTVSINLFDDDQSLNTSIFHQTISPTNLTIHFDLKLQNENLAVGEYEIDSFYQGNKKTKHVRDVVVTNSSFLTVMEGTDMIVFRVDLVGTYRYKKAGSKGHIMVLGCVVGVNYTTSQKMESGFIGMVPPGLDSQLEPPDDDDDY